MTYQRNLQLQQQYSVGKDLKEKLGLINIRNLSFEENFPVIRIGDIMKTSNKKFHIGEIRFPRYRENDQICVITCMKKYLKLTANLRGNVTRLFNTTTKAHKTPSP